MEDTLTLRQVPRLQWLLQLILTASRCWLREKIQSSILQGPYVYRDVFGEVSRQPVMLFREYQISRQNLKHAIELMPEVKAAMHASTGLFAVVPVFAPVMDRLGVSCYLTP